MAVTLNLTPATDPAYLAFLRSQGIEESEAVGEVQRRVSQLNRGLQRRLPNYAEQEKRQQEDTSEGFESRGMFRSGARLVAQQRITDDSTRSRLEDETGTADAIANANSGLARTVAGIRRQTTERELQTRESL